MNIIFYVCDFFLDINECVQENICQNGGTCFNRPGSFYCSCAQGWKGTLCETGKQFHPPPPKIPSSTIYIIVCRISGLISIIWFFKFYFVDVDECVNNICQHGGTCLNTPGSYRCLCPTGWTGKYCERGQWIKCLDTILSRLDLII